MRSGGPVCHLSTQLYIYSSVKAVRIKFEAAWLCVYMHEIYDEFMRICQEAFGECAALKIDMQIATAIIYARCWLDRYMKFERGLIGFLRYT